MSDEGNTSSVFGLAINRRDVLTFPEVNTQRTLRSRVAIAVGGINQPHKHPRAIELGVVITTRVLYLYAV